MGKKFNELLFLENVKNSALRISKSLHGEDFETCIEALSMVIAAISEDYINTFKESSVKEVTDLVVATVKHYVENSKKDNVSEEKIK